MTLRWINVTDYPNRKMPRFYNFLKIVNALQDIDTYAQA